MQSNFASMNHYLIKRGRPIEESDQLDPAQARKRVHERERKRIQRARKKLVTEHGAAVLYKAEEEKEEEHEGKEEEEEDNDTLTVSVEAERQPTSFRTISVDIPRPSFLSQQVTSSERLQTQSPTPKPIKKSPSESSISSRLHEIPESDEVTSDAYWVYTPSSVTRSERQQLRWAGEERHRSPSLSSAPSPSPSPPSSVEPLRLLRQPPMNISQMSIRSRSLVSHSSNAENPLPTLFDTLIRPVDSDKDSQSVYNESSLCAFSSSTPILPEEEIDGDIDGQTDSSTDSEDALADIISVANTHGSRTTTVNQESARETTLQDPIEIARQRVTEKLFTHLYSGFQGCSTNNHAHQFADHISRPQHREHHGLSEAFYDPTFPSVLRNSSFLSAAQLKHIKLPTPDQWQSMFCGLDGERQSPRTICLHKDHITPTTSTGTFDIDSFLGFTNSLAFAKKGIRYQPSPLYVQNITSDLHIRTYLPGMAQPASENSSFQFEAERPSEIPFMAGENLSFHPDNHTNAGETPLRPNTPAQIRSIPHFHLGWLEGGHSISIYILFPRLYERGKEFRSLTQQQYDRWMNKIFLPVLHSQYPSHYTQHLPASYQTSVANSRARQLETLVTSAYHSDKQSVLAHFLHPDRLASVWSDIQHGTTKAGLEDFRDASIFFSAKGTKLQFKSWSKHAPLGDTLTSFKSWLEDLIELKYVDPNQFYVDIGKETCATTSSIQPSSCCGDTITVAQQIKTDLTASHQKSPTGVTDPNQAQVYLWRRCCLESHMKWMYENKPPSSNSSGQQYYVQNMLNDVCTLTSAPPITSQLYKGGLMYSQFYNSVKETVDAAKVFPFQNDGLEELALDPLLQDGARRLGKVQRSISAIEHAYHASKHRAFKAYTDSQSKSFGLREEHRVTWNIYQRLERKIAQAAAENQSFQSHQTLTFAWAIPTVVYLDFIYRNADKFATGFEIIRAQCQRDYVTWEETKMMAMFLRCLYYSHRAFEYRQDSALWWSQRSTSEQLVQQGAKRRTYYGLGFSKTLKHYGYAWFEPRIDWSKLQFRTEITDGVLFGNKHLRDRYLSRGGALQGFFAAAQRIDCVKLWLSKAYKIKRVRRRLISLLAFTVRQRFRIDVLASITNDIQPKKKKQVLTGEQPWSYDYLCEVLNKPPRLTCGNKTAFKKPWRLIEYYIGKDDGRLRDRWEQKPFRILYQRVVAMLQSFDHEHKSQITSVFQATFRRELLAFHWVLPMANGSSLIGRVAGKALPSDDERDRDDPQRVWYSINRLDVGASIPPSEIPMQDWQWVRGAWRTGRPPVEDQRLIDWEKLDWEQWIEAQLLQHQTSAEKASHSRVRHDETSPSKT